MSTKKCAIDWDINPIALMALALWYFFDEDGLFALMAPAILIHELGHGVMIFFTGLGLKRMSLGIFGFEMDYRGELRGLLGFAVIAAGPVFGLLYGLACMGLNSEFLNLSGSISILLSLFNLIPVLPLDGGRLMCLAAGEYGRHISLIISIAFGAVALILWLSRGWISLFIMAVWLIWCNIKGRD